MKLSEIMTADVDTVGPQDTVADAAQIMKNRDVGVVPVAEDGRLAGVLTDRDVVLRVVAEGRDARQTRVSDVMSQGLLYGHPEDDLDETLAAMRDRQVRRIPVVDDERRLVGIVSLGDVAVQGDDRAAGDALQAISTPSEPQG